MISFSSLFASATSSLLNSNVVSSYLEKGIGIECSTVCLPHHTAGDPRVQTSLSPLGRLCWLLQTSVYKWASDHCSPCWIEYHAGLAHSLWFFIYSNPYIRTRREEFVNRGEGQMRTTCYHCHDR
jgi:hypothetical protein